MHRQKGVRYKSSLKHFLAQLRILIRQGEKESFAFFKTDTRKASCNEYVKTV